MDYENLKIQIKEIVEIATGVPENLQVKCFEILMNRLIFSNPDHFNISGNLGAQHREEANVRTGEDHRFSGPMLAFMRHTQITSDDIFSILLIDDGEVHFTSVPKTKKKTQGVADWALLLALTNALLHEKGELRVDPEKLRTVCKEKGYYNRNFSDTLKKNVSPLFGGELEPKGGARKLSHKGEEMLGELIRKLGEKK